MSVFDILDKKIMSLRFGRPDIKSVEVQLTKSTRGPTKATRKRLLFGRRLASQFRCGRTRI